MYNKLGKGDALGPYVIKRSLGSGAMGSVYLAHPQGCEDFDIALKILDPTLGMFHPSEIEEVEKRWKVEYRSMQKIRHPNVIRILAPGVHDGVRYITMDYLQGSDLEAVLKKSELGTDRALKITHGVAKGIAALHSKEIIHRDLKPKNVMVTPDDEAIVFDFGISVMESRTARITQEGMILGTPGYVAPEIITTGNHKPTKASDIYSLGVLTFCCLGGVVPYFRPRDLLTKKLDDILNLDYPGMLRKRGQNNRYLVSLIERMVDRDPEKRPTAQEAAELFGWGVERANLEGTRVMKPMCEYAPYNILVNDARTMTRQDYLQAHREVCGILLGAHCYQNLDTACERNEGCGCQTHVLSSLGDRRYVVGRRADINLETDQISRHHAALSIVGLSQQSGGRSQVVLRDLGSTNGTYVNNIRLRNKQVVLKSHDQISFSNMVDLTFMHLPEFYDKIASSRERRDFA
jgi:hypothetical protein